MTDTAHRFAGLEHRDTPDGREWRARCLCGNPTRWTADKNQAWQDSAEHFMQLPAFQRMMIHRVLEEMLTADCTGVTATWCPVHGDCVCPPHEEYGEDYGRTLNDPGCELHRHDSKHGTLYA